jgi:hypothetical protein
MVEDVIIMAHFKKLNKNTIANKLYMAGGGFSGLTSQTFCSFSCGSDRISLRNPTHQIASSFGLILKKELQHKEL